MLVYLGIIFGIIGQKYSGSAKKHNGGGGGGGGEGELAESPVSSEGWI